MWSRCRELSHQRHDIEIFPVGALDQVGPSCARTTGLDAELWQTPFRARLSS
jgi:hypothetical protein